MSTKIKMNGKTPEEVALEIAHSIKMPRKTKKHIEDLLIPKIRELSPKQIISLRKREDVSQYVMAVYLGVTEKTIQSWEQGRRSPSNSSLRLLHVIKDHGLEIFREHT